MTNINKIINPLSAEFGYSDHKNVFIKIEFKDKNLSMTGVEAPLPSGNAGGSCGQIYKPLSEYDKPKLKTGWTIAKYNKLIKIWEEWHLNDLQPACKHQRELIPAIENKKGKDFFSANNLDNIWKVKGFRKCSICNYKYGSQWKRKEVPNKVLNWLNDLPNSELRPAWI